MRRKKDQDDQLLSQMNKYHKNIKLTIERNPSTFLAIRIDIKENGIYNTEIYRKETKLPIHWSSKVPKRYKRSLIKGDLHRSKKIATDFEKEVT